MTTPEDPTREQPPVAPSVSTAPPPAQPHSWWTTIPRHLGRARTSTIVLSLLFLSIGARWINIRPDVAAPPADPKPDPTAVKLAPSDPCRASTLRPATQNATRSCGRLKR